MPDHLRISSDGDTTQRHVQWGNTGVPDATSITVTLSAVIVAVRDDEPQFLTVRRDMLPELPTGPFSPSAHASLEAGLRAWAKDQTGIELGYAEQLTTFAEHTHQVSIGYLALTRAADALPAKACEWCSWYCFFPWEDWRNGRPQIIDRIVPRLEAWARAEQHEHDDVPDGADSHLSRDERIRIAFGLDGMRWDEEQALERFALLSEAGLIGPRPPKASGIGDGRPLSEPMRLDHARIAAMAIARLRAKIKDRPVVFELMNPNFTLFELQKTVEAILGPNLHKQNFRRLVENTGLVEATGEVRSRTGGRPAKLFRFRREVLLERPSPGLRVHASR